MQKTLRWLQLNQSSEQSNNGSFSANAIVADDKSGTSVSKQDGSKLDQRTTTDRQLHDPPTTCTPTAITSHARSSSQPTNSFELLSDGRHRHYLEDRKRQQKLSRVILNLLGRKKEERLAQNEDSALSPTIAVDDQSKIERERLVLTTNGDVNVVSSLEGRYGACGEVIGRGACGVVRLSHKATTGKGKSEQVYAIKQFRKPPRVSIEAFHKRLTSEFYIASALQHANVVLILDDLLQDAAGNYCQVMEYCPGGDLNTLVQSSGHLEAAEADCYFKQLMRGVNYLHEMGVAHRDLKPDNLLLTTHGVVKITDFGNAECFRLAWENEPSMTICHCGTAPYDAPEEYLDDEFDPRAVDVWATGVIYMAMRTGQLLWALPRRNEDADYKQYLEDRRNEAGYWPIERLDTVSRRKRLLNRRMLMQRCFIYRRRASTSSTLSWSPTPPVESRLRKFFTVNG